MIPCGAYRYKQQVDIHNNFYQWTQEKKYTVIGTITNIDKTKNNQYAISLTTQSFKEKDSKKTNHLNKTILIYTYYLNKLVVGDIILLENISFKKPTNKFFDRYLIKQSVSATVFLPKIKYKLIQRPTFSLIRYIYQTRKNLFFAVKKKCSPKTFALFSSLFLGNRTELKQVSPELEISFKQWGLMHMLARSGLHLVIFLFLLQWLFRIITLSFFIKQIVILCISCIYFLFSWPSISFIRAFTIFCLYKITAIKKLPFHFFHTLNLISLILLIINPAQLFFLDFQFTFLFTAILSWFSSVEHAKKVKH